MQIQDFQKKKQFLLCVDSDGCAIDTMDVKHKECFGPCMIHEWKLEKWQDKIQERWNEINLYSMTRGINRFKGLALALSEINETYQHIDGVEELVVWAKEAKELSNHALQEIIDHNGSEIFKKSLQWSIAVNEAITKLPWSKKRAFAGVSEAFDVVKDTADIVIVSSANREAVAEEWERFGLLSKIDLMLCQDAGSKAHCIEELQKKGYAKEDILMVGDAPGDLAAATSNQVYFYPVLVGDEEKSWKELPHAMELLQNHNFEEYSKEKTEEFMNNLSKGRRKDG